MIAATQRHRARSTLVWAIVELDIAFALGVCVGFGPPAGAPDVTPLLFIVIVASLGVVGALVATQPIAG